MPRGQLSRKPRSTISVVYENGSGTVVLPNLPAHRQQVPPRVGVAGLLREENQQIDGRDSRPARVVTTVAERAALRASAAQTGLPCAKA